MKQWIKYWVIVLCLLKVNLCLAVNPVDAVLIPSTRLPSITHIGDQYTVAYTFTNNLKYPVLIHVTGSPLGSGFVSDELCANITLTPKGQPGSTCTTYIDFNPTSSGVASFNVTLQYHHNVIQVHPNLTTLVKGLCGRAVYPSNTGIPVPDPIIDSN